MEDSFYSVVPDPTRNLIEIRFSSAFWEDSTLDCFKQACFSAIALLRCPLGEHLVLIDLNKGMIQSQELIIKIQDFLRHTTARKIALVSGSSLAQLQIKRLRVKNNIKAFYDMEAAVSWLGANLLADK